MTDVIFVPGLPGSELNSIGPQGGKQKFFPSVADQLFGKVPKEILGPEDIVNDADPVEAGPPIENVKIFIFDAKQAGTLYDLLRNNCGLSDAQIHPVGWDWRRPVDDHRARARVEKAILDAPMGSVLVVHSTGGLVAKSVLTRTPGLCDRLKAVIAFGVPWMGTLKPMAVLREHHKTPSASPKAARKVSAYSYAAIDLLPRANAGLTLAGNGQAYDLFATAEWLPADPQFLREQVKVRLDRSTAQLGVLDPAWKLPVPLHNVCGFGTLTTVSARVASAGATVQFDVNGAGNALSFAQRCWGDGTIPFVSAASASQGPGGGAVHQWRVPVGAYRTMGKEKHGSLWLNPGSVRVLEHVVGGQAQQPWVDLAMDTSAYDIHSPIRLRWAAFESDGTASQPVKLRILSPAAGVQQTEFDLGAAGFGMHEFARNQFQRTHNDTKYRVVVELRTPNGTTDVFAVVPRV